MSEASNRHPGRDKLSALPLGIYEIPGRPHTIFQVKEYASPDVARREIPFLFQAFETGQKPPPGMAGKSSHKRQKQRSTNAGVKANGSKSFGSAPAAAAAASTAPVGVVGDSSGVAASPQAASVVVGEAGATGAKGTADVATDAAGARNGKGCSPSGQLHAPTIHEYLDWTVTSKCTRENSQSDPELVSPPSGATLPSRRTSPSLRVMRSTATDALSLALSSSCAPRARALLFLLAKDFEGFRVITVCGRHRPAYPRPGDELRENSAENEKMKLPWMGKTMPPLALDGKPYSAATIRTGYGGKPGKYWLEVPFFATAPSKRGRGYGRCLLDAIELVCNMLKIDTIHLCSTNDPTTVSIWKRLGFTADETTINDKLQSCGLTLKR